MKWTRKKLIAYGWTYLGYVWFNREVWSKDGKLMLINRKTRKAREW